MLCLVIKAKLHHLKDPVSPEIVLQREEYFLSNFATPAFLLGR